MSDLREIGFSIHEAPGSFLARPSSWRKITRYTLNGPLVDHTGDVFICETCKKTIEEEQLMFLDLREEATTKGWRHAYLDNCGKVAYTVGVVSSYDSDIDAKAAKGEKVHKMGRMTAEQTGDGEPYEGGWIWRTRAEAQAKLDDPEKQLWKGGREFKVYGVLLAGTWESDVSPELYEDGVHRLWVTSTEVFKLPCQ